MQFLRKITPRSSLFAQFLRCVPNFAAICSFGAGGPPPPPQYFHGAK